MQSSINSLFSFNITFFSFFSGESHTHTYTHICHEATSYLWYLKAMGKSNL